MHTLFMAITGGLNWFDAYAPLRKVSLVALWLMLLGRWGEEMQPAKATVDGRIIQTLVIQEPPHPQFQCFFSGVASLLRMDEIKQTWRAGTKMQNHNVEIWGMGGCLQLMDAGFE